MNFQIETNFHFPIKPRGSSLVGLNTKTSDISSPYFGSGSFYDRSYLYALNTDGSIKWKVASEDDEWFVCSPVIGKNRTIYAGTKNYLYAVSPDGKIKWKFKRLDDGRD